MNPLSLEVVVDAGTTIGQAAEAAVLLARRLGVGLEFEFNGTRVFVMESDSAIEVANRYDRLRRSRAGLAPPSPEKTEVQHEGG